MKQPSNYMPRKDERDEQINLHSKSTALDFMIAATQILTILCLIKPGVERQSGHAVFGVCSQAIL